MAKKSKAVNLSECLFRAHVCHFDFMLRARWQILCISTKSYDVVRWRFRLFVRRAKFLKPVIFRPRISSLRLSCGKYTVWIPASFAFLNDRIGDLLCSGTTRVLRLPTNTALATSEKRMASPLSSFTLRSLAIERRLLMDFLAGVATVFHNNDERLCLLFLTDIAKLCHSSCGRCFLWRV